MPAPAWLAAFEGFYGPPLSHEQRPGLIGWLPSGGLTDYAYAPRDDLFHQDQWRTPYPAGHLVRVAETLAAAQECGIELTLSISPGLDWRGEVDAGALAAKLRQLYDLGVRSLGVFWDDVPPGGEELGRSHRKGVAAAMRALPHDLRWFTVDTEVPAAVAGTGFSLMSLPLASQPGLDLAARHWHDPHEDRELAWRDVVDRYPGLTPLARSCQSWLTDPGPDPEPVSWTGPALQGDGRRLSCFDAGCRAALPFDRQAALESWLSGWEAAAQFSASVLRVIPYPSSVNEAPDIGTAWPRLPQRDTPVFGIRFASYGVSSRVDDRLLPHPASAVQGNNLTNLVVQSALEGLLALAQEQQ